MKKILFITYYWPPSGGGGVQRCLKFVKYLNRLADYQPIVLTAENPNYSVIDKSLQKDVPPDLTLIKCPITEPYDLYKRLMTGGKKKSKVPYGSLEPEEKKGSILQNMAIWVRGNLFIPDARFLWIKPAVRHLLSYLRDNPVNLIISSGPPHTTHLIARNIKRKTGIKWIADFRDPWTNVEYYSQLKLSKWADKKHKVLEQSVLKEADRILTVSWHWAKDLSDLSDGKQTATITNGFDEEDFLLDKNTILHDTTFSLGHFGTLVQDRNAESLWKTLALLSEKIPAFKDDLEIKLAGHIDNIVLNQLKQYGLLDKLKRIDYMPHEEVVKAMAASQVLLLMVNNSDNALGHIPGKTFEYLAARRPVICIGPLKGDSARIIQTANAGTALDYEDEQGMFDTLKEYYEDYKAGRLQLHDSRIEEYSRKFLTGKLVTLIEEVLV